MLPYPGDPWHWWSPWWTRKAPQQSHGRKHALWWAGGRCRLAARTFGLTILFQNAGWKQKKRRQTKSFVYHVPVPYRISWDEHDMHKSKAIIWVFFFPKAKAISYCWWKTRRLICKSSQKVVKWETKQRTRNGSADGNINKMSCRIWAPKTERVPVPVRSPRLFPLLIMWLKSLGNY